MANEHYDEFCRATYPDLTWLERQLLGHYCARFNETVTPPRAWPGLLELMNITSAHPKSISRALGKLTRKDYLSRVTRASKERGMKAEYAPNMRRIRSQIKVTEELPNIQDVSHLQVTEGDLISNPASPLSNPPVAVVPPQGYPKPKEPIKPNNVDRFTLTILNSLPERLRTINPGLNFEILLDECDELGITDDVRLMLTANRWDNVTENPGGLVISLIKKAIERKRLNLPVVPQGAVTTLPPPFKAEERVITPRSADTEALIEALRKGKGWGTLPD
jgi:hypothetical protein